VIKGHVRADTYSQLGSGHKVSHPTKRECAYAEELLETVAQLEAIAYRVKLIKASATKDVLLKKTWLIYKLQPSVEVILVKEVSG